MEVLFLRLWTLSSLLVVILHLHNFCGKALNEKISFISICVLVVGIRIVLIDGSPWEFLGDVGNVRFGKSN
ncbi:hypothetical protein AUF16_06045 [Enterococcus avium]|nr:hypothetical protein AUF16_06045 [Enterococcus avium]